MLRNYLLVAIRRLRRQKIYLLINTIGLSIGIACSVLIIFYLHHELTYDRHHSKADRIYRITVDIDNSGNVTRAATSPWALGPNLKRDFPDIEEFTRLSGGYNTWLGIDNEKIHIEEFCIADTTIFDIFDYEFISGNPANALSRPNTIVVTESLAKKLAGDDNPVGMTVTFGDFYDVEITGVVKDFTRPGHLNFDFILSMTGVPEPQGANVWYRLMYFTFILVNDNFNVAEFEEKLPDFIERHAGEIVAQHGMKLRAHIQPLTSIHLKAGLEGELHKSGDITHIFIFTSAAIVILLIACINFVNLTTAFSVNRTMEVGVRKVFGARKRDLIVQFFIESTILIVLTFFTSLALIELFLPFFNHLTNLSIPLTMLSNHVVLTLSLGIFTVVLLFTGSIPGIIFASYQPVDVLKGQLKRGKTGQRLRRVLVLVQFSISVTLIIGTIVAFRQVQFLQGKELGFEKNNRVCIRLHSKDVLTNTPVLKERFLQDPRILSATASYGIPGRGFMIRLFMPEGTPDNEVVKAGLIIVDEDYLETFGIEMAEGRFFNRDYPADSTNWVINESMAKKLGWEKPIGKKFDFTPRGVSPGEVIGVVKDYHHLSLHNEIEPMVLHMGTIYQGFLTLKIDGTDVKGTLESIRNTWKDVAPSWPLDYFFIEDDYNNVYSADKRFGELFGALALVAIIIACMGLLGLTAYMSQQRTKEIGIRKVIGASSLTIVELLTFDFLKLVVIADLIAGVLAWFVVQRWLDTFVYKMNMDLFSPLVAAALSVIIALFAISGHALKAALANPAKSLRYE